MNAQRQAAKQFVEYWTFNRHGSEKSGCQQYWNMLLGKVLGMTELESGIRYEVPVQLKGATKFLDAWIPSTRVLIEQKSRGVKLDTHQPGHDNMTPFEQAKFYDDHRPFDEKARWIVTCNFDEIWIYDQTRPLDDPEKIRIANLPKEYTRLAFLVNSEVKKVARRELEISVQAGKIVGALYDALLKQYAEPDSPETLKALNKLCVRLVFCLYAEDADVFDKNIFQKLVMATAAVDLRRKLLTLFQVLDTPVDKRDKYLEPELAAFPYTNGGLYRDATVDEIPPMTEEIRKLLVSSSDFDWNGINTTIFGALFESTLNPETRRAGGMVYTSGENIHKQIDPLFLNDLERRFEEIVGGAAVSSKPPYRAGNVDGRAVSMRPPLTKERRKRLLELQDHIASLLFLDPASGSGNFLTETYTSLRRLENRIIAAIQGDQPELDLGLRVKVSIDQFHGIEINDFAVTVAKTAMWITEAKMARETAELLHREADFLPLKDYDGIVEGNALRMDWNALLGGGLGQTALPVDGRAASPRPPHFNYIIGNPPFVGQNRRSREQADDMQAVFAGTAAGGKLDYVAAWFKMAFDYMSLHPETRSAFVASNSLVQGESVSLLTPVRLDLGSQIDFAWRTFAWDSEAEEKAHVHVVIVGFSKCGTPEKFLFDERGERHVVKSINGYLAEGVDRVLKSRSSNINPSPVKVHQGSPSADDKQLSMSREVRDELVAKHPELDPVLLPYVGGDEYINEVGFGRYCIWMVGRKPSDFIHIPEMRERFRHIHDFRLTCATDRVRRTADAPHLFTQVRQPTGDYILIPRVSSEKRKYVPVGFLPKTVIASESSVVVEGGSLVDFGLISSSVHNAWLRSVCGRLEMRYRYSPAVYYNFPQPTLDDAARTRIAETAQGILDARAIYADKPLADIYGEDMYFYPEVLKAHEANDAAVLAAYGFNPEATECEIVSRLFDMYEKLTGRE